MIEKTSNPLDRIRRKVPELKGASDEKVVDFLIEEWIESWEGRQEEEARERSRIAEQMSTDPSWED